MPKKAKQKIPFEGRWSITWMDQWDQDYVDEQVEGFIEFGPKGLGSFQLDQVEQVVRDASRRFRLRSIAADPYQAELLISRLSRQSVSIQSRPQTGRNLTEQAGMLLEVINSRNLDSCRFEPLESDLRQVIVEEKSYGFRLVSPRGPDGHGDVVSALSMGLAAAKEVHVTNEDLRTFAQEMRALAIGRHPIPYGSPWS